jgi:hypothetical protein
MSEPHQTGVGSRNRERPAGHLDRPCRAGRGGSEQAAAEGGWARPDLAVVESAPRQRGREGARVETWMAGFAAPGHRPMAQLEATR